MKKIFTIIALGLALTVTSCKDYFDLQRPNQYPWQNASELDMAVRAPYLYYVGAAWANPIGASFNRFGESDMARFTGKTGDSYYYAYWSRMYKNLVLENSKELEGGFEYLYYMVTACNAPLALLEEAEAAKKDPFPDMTDADKELVKRVKGELLFCRAFAYWNLARIWCPPYDSNNTDGINDTKHFVLYTHYENSSDKLKNPELATTAQVYDQIVKDLQDAVSILPESYYSGDNNNRMRVNKSAARALLARVYFSMGKFYEAKGCIDAVIAKKDLYDLDDDVVAPFNKMSGEGTSKEVIFEIAYSSSSDRYDRNPGIMGYAAYNGHGEKMCGYCAFSMSYYGCEKIGWLDSEHKVTEEAKKDKRFQNLYIYHPGNSAYPEPAIYIFKYFRGATPTTNGRRANRPIIRLADLYLMRAQINLMSGVAGGTEAALQDINAIRHRAGLENLTSVTEEDIDNERIKEMVGENGDRIFWLQALHKDIPLGDAIGDRAKAAVMKYPYKDCYYNIPVFETQTNNAYK